VRDEQIIGDKRPRHARGCDDDLLAQAAASDEPMTSQSLQPKGSLVFTLVATCSGLDCLDLFPVAHGIQRSWVMCIHASLRAIPSPSNVGHID